MTLIINILHNDFSLLVADRRATTNGATTIKAGNVTIKSEKGLTITGFNKIHKSAKNAVALGIAGDANEHKYLKQFEEADTVDEAVAIVDFAISQYANFSDRRRLSGIENLPTHQGILSFHDKDLRTFFSLVYGFSWIHKALQQYRAPEIGIRMHSCGSGANHLGEIIKQEDLDRIAKESTTETDFVKCFEWIKPIYLQVSERDKSVSDCLVAFVSRRSSPEFVEVL